MTGIEQADSWATDGHKWLNVPYDSGFVFCAHPEAHAACHGLNAAYLRGRADGRRRRATSAGVVAPGPGFASWAAIRELGRIGIADLVDRCCALAQRFADGLGAVEGIPRS